MSVLIHRLNFLTEKSDVRTARAQCLFLTAFLLSKTGDLIQQGFRIFHVLALLVLQSFLAEFSLVLLTCDYCYALLSIADMLFGTVAAAAVAAAIVAIAAIAAIVAVGD